MLQTAGSPFVVNTAGIIGQDDYYATIDRNNTGWRTECYTIDCTHNTFLLLHKHMASGTELILTGWKIVPNESLLIVCLQGAHLVQECARNRL